MHKVPEILTKSLDFRHIMTKKLRLKTELFGNKNKKHKKTVIECLKFILVWLVLTSDTFLPSLFISVRPVLTAILTSVYNRSCLFQTLCWTLDPDFGRISSAVCRRWHPWDWHGYCWSTSLFRQVFFHTTFKNSSFFTIWSAFLLLNMWELP